MITAAAVLLRTLTKPGHTDPETEKRLSELYTGSKRVL